MPVEDYFSVDYAAARAKFRSAAGGAGASLDSYEMPGHVGPHGERLSIDVAGIGPDDAEQCLLVISGTHGVEGFCGSGCQVGLLSDRLQEALPQYTRAVLLHSLNPHGFAWLRRVNEDGVDLNRNFVDFAGPLPASAEYESLHDWLVPADWDGSGRRAADAELQAFIRTRGARAFQRAVSGGQYTRPTGLFFGGTAPTWSASTLRSILEHHLPRSTRQLAVIDIHTGLGPTGYGEPISIGRTPADVRRAVEWYGADVRSLAGDGSVSAVVTGSVADGLLAMLPVTEVTYVALEFGTKPLDDVVSALRADHWLHAVGNAGTALRPEINRQMRDTFFVDTAPWKAAVYGRTADLAFRACRALSAISR